MIWYLVVGILYLLISFIVSKSCRNHFRKLSSESPFPLAQVIIFLTIVQAVVFWPFALVLDVVGATDD